MAGQSLAGSPCTASFEEQSASQLCMCYLASVGALESNISQNYLACSVLFASAGCMCHLALVQRVVATTT